MIQKQSRVDMIIIRRDDTVDLRIGLHFVDQKGNEVAPTEHSRLILLPGQDVDASMAEANRQLVDLKRPEVSQAHITRIKRVTGAIWTK